MKKYTDFNSIKVSNCPGVSPVDRDTLLLASLVGSLEPESFLDLGCGTGFLAIYASTLGIRAKGCDISHKAVLCASLNAKRNKADIEFFVSDMFSNVTGKYDLISFNPPVGGSKNARLTKVIEAVKYKLHKQSRFMNAVAIRIFSLSRKKLIQHLLKEGMSHLNDEGKLLLAIHEREARLLNSYKRSEAGTHDLGPGAVYKIYVVEKE